MWPAGRRVAHENGAADGMDQKVQRESAGLRARGFQGEAMAHRVLRSAMWHPTGGHSGRYRIAFQ